MIMELINIEQLSFPNLDYKKILKVYVGFLNNFGSPVAW